ncbi:MAG: hypothetical protein AAF541_02545 [Pseudomonadota bacterium]
MNKWMIKRVLFGLGVAVSCLFVNAEETEVNPLDPATYDPASLIQSENQGVIEALNFANNTATIGGYLLAVSPQVKVEIGGSYGAFTMLSQGMKVRYKYLEFDDGSILITEIYEDPTAEEF